VMFLLSSAPTLVIAEADQLPPRLTPSYLISIAPIAPGSVSAIAPLPKASAVPAVIAKATPASDPGETHPVDYWQVVASGLNVRSEASSSSRRIGSLQGGERVVIEAQNGKWALVRSDSGLRGWVFTRYLAKNTAALTE
jgi:uncharacterized protein YgiM (DUF1202 family)